MALRTHYQSCRCCPGCVLSEVTHGSFCETCGLATSNTTIETHSLGTSSCASAAWPMRAFGEGWSVVLRRTLGEWTCGHVVSGRSGRHRRCRIISGSELRCNSRRSTSGLVMIVEWPQSERLGNGRCRWDCAKKKRMHVNVVDLLWYRDHCMIQSISLHVSVSQLTHDPCIPCDHSTSSEIQRARLHQAG